MICRGGERCAARNRSTNSASVAAPPGPRLRRGPVARACVGGVLGAAGLLRGRVLKAVQRALARQRGTAGTLGLQLLGEGRSPASTPPAGQRRVRAGAGPA